MRTACADRTARTLGRCTLVALNTLLALAAVSSPLVAGGGDDAASAAVADPFAAPAPLEVAVHRGESAVRPGESDATIAVVLRIKEGWHVNAHEPLEEWLIPTEVVVTEPEGVEVTEVVFPEAHQLTFEFSDGPMAVYEGNAPIGLRLRLPDGADDDEITVRGIVAYQACNDHTCLAPEEAPFSVVLPVARPGEEITRSDHPIFTRIAFATATERATPAVAGDGTSTDEVQTAEDEGGGITAWLTRTIEGNFANPLLAGLLTLFAGLLSAATPCVYPMIPITARILLGRGGDNPALGRMHAGMYFAGIIVVYAILGLIASATGGGFNELMRIPLVILAFAIFFALLGLSMLGLYEIQIPSGLATKIDGATSRRAGLGGTMLMGLGAGLVVSPCVGPVVFAILAQIANQIAAVDAAGGGAFSKTGQLAYGGLLMGAYGAGLGIPFLVVGLFSARAMIAKPGGWMTAVRVALGIVILYFAFGYFHKALATAGVERGVANAILAGVVLTFLAVLWGVFRPHVEAGPHAGWQRVKHAVTILMLVVGVFYLWTGLERSGLVAGGATGIAVELAQSGTPSLEDSHGLIWHRDFAEAEQLAQESSRPLFVDFYAHWCANCKVFAANAAKEGPLRTALESVVRAKVYDTDPIFQEFRDDPRFGELKRGLPFFLLLSSDGEFLWKGTDYRAEDTFVREIRDALARESAAASPPGGDLRVHRVSSR